MPETLLHRLDYHYTLQNTAEPLLYEVCLLAAPVKGPDVIHFT